MKLFFVDNASKNCYFESSASLSFYYFFFGVGDGRGDRSVLSSSTCGFKNKNMQFGHNTMQTTFRELLYSALAFVRTSKKLKLIP